MRCADEGGDPFRLRSDRLEGLLGGAEEARPEEEVLGRIAGDRELGEEDELGAGLPCLTETFDDAGAVALEVADHGVHLRERETHAVDSSGLRLGDEN